jgi:hypothetical protein
MAEPRVACIEWQDDIAAWVTAQGSPQREAALMAHLEGCERCREEAESLLAVAAVVLATDPDVLSAPLVEPEVELVRSFDDGSTHPPADLADRISARIRGERRRHLVRRSIVAAVGAAAAALVLVVAVGLRSGHDVAPLRGQHFAFAELPAGAAASAVVGTDAVHGSLVQLTASGLDPHTTYALWLTPPGGSYDDRVPAGTFRPDAHGHVDTRLHSALPPSQVGRVWATTPDRHVALDTA